MKHLRHDQTSLERWSYDPSTRTVLAHFVDGPLDIPVCTQKHPRNRAFFIARRGADDWQISPARCVTTGVGFAARPASYDRMGVHCDFIQLSGAPEWVSAMMSDLYEAEPFVDEDAPTVSMCPCCNAKGYTVEGECELCHGKCTVSIQVAHDWGKLTR